MKVSSIWPRRCCKMIA